MSINDVTLTDLAILDSLGILDEAESDALQRLLPASSAEEAAEYREATRLIAESLAPVPPPAGIRARLLETVAKTKIDETLPAVSHTVRSDEGQWTAILPGVEIKKLSHSRARRTVTLLLRMQPNSMMPAHDHRGAEDSYILRGSCRIGAVGLSAGDFHHVEGGSRHGDVVTDSGCTMLLVCDEADCLAA